MNLEGKRVLVLSPHPDDGELGAGGTITKMISSNADIFWVLFSFAEESISAEFDIKKEFLNSMDTLGIRRENIINQSFNIRHFPSNRQNLLEELVKIKKDVQPSLVLIPSTFDIHQDHSTVSQESIRAFKHTNILGYEEPWNNISNTKLDFFSKLTEGHLLKKINAVDEYNSQKDRTYVNKDYIRSLAIVRGQQANVKLAEAFEMIRWID